MSERQGIIAKNIANANTPGYVARDIEAPRSGHARKHRLGMVRTSSMHMSGNMPSSSSRLIDDTTAELKPNGNQVDLVHEVDKASQTNLDYNLTTNLYKKMSGMMKKAAGGQ
ncbi:MAG: flagellar basal body rod protein FlgB [Alphaproteobacteria bacterium]|nr:flagellar basal body rod protein FlgB [Alphaproteobacteria bacterium]